MLPKCPDLLTAVRLVKVRRTVDPTRHTLFCERHAAVFNFVLGNRSEDNYRRLIAANLTNHPTTYYYECDRTVTNFQLTPNGTLQRVHVGPGVDRITTDGIRCYKRAFKYAASVLTTTTHS
ncbi:hypothetical protein Bbelb_106080 [Branchiostoma belcheri]|nr:hypothetical protein Bbelb_106080 [Branchiostoma belcheri]